jgi:hypothetical protein
LRRSDGEYPAGAGRSGTRPYFRGSELLGSGGGGERSRWLAWGIAGDFWKCGVVISHANSYLTPVLLMAGLCPLLNYLISQFTYNILLNVHWIKALYTYYYFYLFFIGEIIIYH